MHYNCYYIKGWIDQQREREKNKNKTKHYQQQRNNNNKKTRNGQIFDKLVNLVVWKGEDC